MHGFHFSPKQKSDKCGMYSATVWQNTPEKVYTGWSAG